MRKPSKVFGASCLFLFMACFIPAAGAAELTEEYPVVRLQSLDKATARTMTFEARVGGTIKFGQLFIKVRACRKSPPIEQPEAAAFLQIWEAPQSEEPKWIFSGWMFASSPGLSSMDHPIYDVWVLDCLPGRQDAEAGEANAGPEAEQTVPEEPLEPMEEPAPQGTAPDEIPPAAAPPQGDSEITVEPLPAE